jgi:MerR family transcriptional regulator/heat shock protein HspR
VQAPTYSIGEAADLLGLSVPTLRLYEREGLILPIRRASRHRVYTEADLDRIRCLREMINHKKVSIAGVRTLLSMIPCWRIKPCPEEIRTGCPAYEATDRPCWMVENKPWRCSRADCRACPVYAESSNCDNVKHLIAHGTTPPAHPD